MFKLLTVRILREEGEGENGKDARATSLSPTGAVFSFRTASKRSSATSGRANYGREKTATFWIRHPVQKKCPNYLPSDNKERVFDGAADGGFSAEKWRARAGSRAQKMWKMPKIFGAMSGGLLQHWVKVKAPCCSGVDKKKKHWSSELNPCENTFSPSFSGCPSFVFSLNCATFFCILY